MHFMVREIWGSYKTKEVLVFLFFFFNLMEWLETGAISKLKLVRGSFLVLTCQYCNASVLLINLQSKTFIMFTNGYLLFLSCNTRILMRLTPPLFFHEHFKCNGSNVCLLVWRFWIGILSTGQCIYQIGPY